MRREARAGPAHGAAAPRAREGARRQRRDPAPGRRRAARPRPGVNGRTASRSASTPCAFSARNAASSRALVEDHVQHPREQRGVLARARLQVHVRAPRRLAAARIDHDEAKPARHRLRQAAAGVLARNSGALRDQRILPDDQPGVGRREILCARVPAAVQRGGDLLARLVDGVRREEHAASRARAARRWRARARRDRGASWSRCRARRSAARSRATIVRTRSATSSMARPLAIGSKPPSDARRRLASRRPAWACCSGSALPFGQV